MTHLERLTALRQQMRKQHIDAYLIASSDPHISEYLPDRFRSMAWLSGFTGSAGTLVVTQDFAGLWTDSRYFVQAGAQLQGSGFELVPLKAQGAPEYIQWIKAQVSPKATLGFDGKTTPMYIAQQAKSMLSCSIKADADLIEAIWEQRPELPKEPAFLLSEELSGASAKNKIERIRTYMDAQQVNYHLVSTLDDISWIFNIRGKDVHCNPVVLSYALFSPEKVQLFIDTDKLQATSIETLTEQGVEVHAYTALAQALESIPKDTRVWIDPRRTCYENYQFIPKHCKVYQEMNPSTLLKAVKNSIEVQHIRETMVLDGIALSRFFYWLEQHIGKQPITEMDIAEKLLEFRGQHKDFVGESFDTIAGYKHHGALPHYKAIESSNLTLSNAGLLLIDSGGQYLSGTTDITRVVSLGQIQEAEKVDYTLVLKAMIEGSRTPFPQGTRGYSIDAITRRPLWQHLRNYGHGTGHGVGFFLNVHEGPHVINTAAVDIPLEPGMLNSIEPGLYREGAYGIRIENLVCVQEAEENALGKFLNFETLTLCYIETDLIDKALLEKVHIDWLNAYHLRVWERIGPHLNPEEQAWLKKKTAAI